MIRITHFDAANGKTPIDPLWVKDVFARPLEKTQSDSWNLDFHGDVLEIKNTKFKKSFACSASTLISKEKIRLSINTDPDESFFGWGEWFNAFRRTKGQLHLRNLESPAFLQNRQTYSNIPVFFSSRGYLFFLLNGFPSTWKIRPCNETISVEISNGNMDYLIITGENPKEILEQYTNLTGKPPLLPKWAFGLWMTEYPQEDQEKTLAIAKEHHKRDIPLDSLILDYHWEEKFHNFQWRKFLFPNPAGFIKDLHKCGIHLGLIFTPFINKQHRLINKLLLWLYARSIPPKTFKDNESDTVDYDQGKANNFFANDNAAWWFGKGGMVDFTNPNAAQWWTEKLAPLYKDGVDFFKNDDGEYLPKESRSSLGLESEEFHNLYGFYYGKSIYENMQQLDNRRPIIYSRSVWAGSQRYPGMFLGDQKADFPNMQRAFWAGLNMSLLGFNYWTADCFGLSGKTTPEVHMRYAQWALLVPIARYFFRPSSIDRTRFPWSYGELVEKNFKKYCNLRYRLLPYYYSQAWNSCNTGVPVFRPLWFEFPADSASYKIQDQAMIGSDIMIAPVFINKARKRLVYFPRGNWFNFWTNEQITGAGGFEVDVPFDQLPMFIRDGAIIPFGKQLMNMPAEHRFDQLEIHNWGNRANSFRIYDDDGLSTNYSQGEYLIRDISTFYENGRTSIEITASGHYPSLNDKESNYQFHMHKKASLESIVINGKNTQVDAINESPDKLVFNVRSKFTDTINISLR